MVMGLIDCRVLLCGHSVVIIVRYLIGPNFLIGFAVWFNYFVAIYSTVHVTVYSVVGSSSVADVFQLIKAYKTVEVLCSTILLTEKKKISERDVNQ